MCISSRARLSTKIMDSQLDAWLQFSVSMCEWIQVQLTIKGKHAAVEATSRLTHCATATLLKMLCCLCREVVPPDRRRRKGFHGDSSAAVRHTIQRLLSACLLARYNLKLEHFHLALLERAPEFMAVLGH